MGINPDINEKIKIKRMRLGIAGLKSQAWCLTKKKKYLRVNHIFL